MKNSVSHSRRNFIKQSSIASSALILPLNTITANLVTNEKHYERDLKVFLFSKSLQFLDYDNMCEATREMGFDGIDLAVRPGAHVIPERISEDLPRAVKAMKSIGFQPLLMTTNVTNATNPESRTVLETASNLGFKYYRMGWLKYPEGESIPNSIETFEHQFIAMEKLNKELGLHGAYQNHAGNYMGAPIWDLYQILKGRAVEYIGCQYDIRHATVEGGSSWELGLNLIKNYIKTIVIKDFRWGKVNGIWKPLNTQLGEGMVKFDRYFSLLKKYNINVPVSLHFEYDLGGAEHGKSKLTMDRKLVFGKMKKDLQYLREAWDKAN